jgi:uncharacterized protein with ATP-grasp and redox domains
MIHKGLYAMEGKLDCIACAVKQLLNTVRMATPDEKIHHDVMHEVLRYLLDADWSQSPAVVSTGAYHLLNDMTGNKDPFLALKKYQNTTAMGLLATMQQAVKEADDPLHTAAKIAIIGNIIDCGIQHEHDIQEEFETGMRLTMAVDDFELFRERLNHAQRLFYACDNAGEIVFDRVFMEQILKHKPDIELVACVRGGPILNDATREDADITGISDIVHVIDTGIDAIGIPLTQVSDETRNYLDTSDIIISKGQGNFETLDEITDGRVFFILRAKCPLIAEKFGVPLNSIIFEHFEAPDHT